jgi:hypothetical protein
MNKNLEYFIGKVCTITTLGINFKFQYEHMVDYFNGHVEFIDSDGIFMKHNVTGCGNYIFLKHIVSIAEEQVLYADNPNDAELIREYEKEKPITAKKMKIPESPPNSPYVDPSALQQMLNKAKS